MTKQSAAWGFLLLPLFLAWAVLMRVAFVLAGHNPGEYTGMRGHVMLLLAIVGTVFSLRVAWENAPNGN